MSRYNWVFLSTLIVTCLVCISSATDKEEQVEDVAESSRRESKRIRKTGAASTSVQRSNIDYRVLAVSLVDEIKSAKPKCSPEELIKTKELGEQASTSFLVECDKQVQHWLEQKTSRLDSIGAMINRWMKIYTFSPGEKLVNFDSLFQTKFFELYNTWSENGIDLYGELAAETSLPAYYFGEGICNHILAAPFGGVEKLMDVVLRDFKYLDQVKNYVLNPGTIPKSMVIYIIQKQCQKSSHIPKNLEGITDVSTYELDLIENVNEATAFIKDHLERIKKDEQTDGYKCDWSGIYSRKQLYNILNRFRDDQSLRRIKADADKSTDAFVENCLLMMQTPDSIDKLYEGGGNEVDKILLQNVADRLRKIVESCDISSEESINNVLEIQSSTSCREHIIQGINQTIIFKNLEFVKIFIDLLAGNLGDLDVGLFKKSIYANITSIEYKTIEFLTSVFNFKGYKPRKEILSPLLSFYYLYKLSEIFTISRQNGSIQHVSKAARNLADEYVVESSTRASIQPVIASSSTQNQGKIHDEQSTNYRRFAINLLDKIIIGQANCDPDKFIKTVTVRRSNIGRFIDECDELATELLENKIERLQSIGKVIESTMTIIIKIFKKRQATFVWLVNKDLRENTRFRERMYNIWRKRQSDVYGDLARENSKLAYYFGDGICIHIFAPPFDKIKKLMDVVFKDFQDLEFIKGFKRRRKREKVSVCLKIYFLQKQCQEFYESPQNPYGKIIVPTEGIDPIEDAGQAFAFIKTRLENIKELEQKAGYTCNWLMIYNRKHLYNILDRFRDDQSLRGLKADADKSIDALVENCLLKIAATSNTAASNEVTDVIYERIKSVEERNLVLEMGNRLKTVIDNCEVSSEESINNVLDINSPSSCGNLIIQRITHIVLLNTNTELVKLHIDLLSGYLGRMKEGMFREPIYSNLDNIEYKSLEFLTNIFSIKGYKPNPEIENPLINFYYLYKLSEICNISFEGKSTKAWSKVAINLNSIS